MLRTYIKTDIRQQYFNYSRYEIRRWHELNSYHIHGWADVWEQTVQKWPANIVVREVQTQQVWTYAELDQAAYKIAQWAIATQQQYLGVYLDNGALLLATVIGLMKAGIVAVLLNVRDPVHVLLERTRACGLHQVLGDPIPGMTTIHPTDILQTSWYGQPLGFNRAWIKLDDPAVISFTSGTSGYSKPALLSHRRLIGSGITWSLRTHLSSTSRCYITLPLYHSNGLAIAFASCVQVGACAVVRDRVSVRAFWSDIQDYVCTAALYTGELWRYLITEPPCKGDTKHSLRVIFGHGLTTSLWQTVVQRFGIERIVEHYSATEMPANALINCTGQAGYCGFIPPDHPDADAIVLVDDSGKPVAPDEPGQALFRVPGNQYRGYFDPSLNEAQLWRDLFQPGDLWWRSGDLLARNTDGFFRFVDRLDDSFCWQGEKVASLEVEEALLSSGMVQEAIVYGVHLPGTAGKVGMASLLAAGCSSEAQLLSQLLKHLQQRLPSYAIPVILRFVPARHPTTATLKIQKAHFAAQGLTHLRCYPHFILRVGQYVPLTDARLAALDEAG